MMMVTLALRPARLFIVSDLLRLWRVSNLLSLQRENALVTRKNPPSLYMMKTMIWDQVSWITCLYSVFWADFRSSTTGCPRTQDQLHSLHLFQCTNEACQIQTRGCWSAPRT